MNTENTENTESQAPTVPSSGSFYFWTTGESMTWMARDLVREGRHEAGAQLLVDSLGMTWDQAFEVLAGKTCLTGNSKKVEDGGTGGLGLEDEDPENEETIAYRKAIRQHYAGRYHDVDKWFRPYAFITGFDRWDLVKPYEGPAPQDVVKTRHWGDMPWRRAMHYANHPEADRCVALTVPYDNVTMQRWVLFEQCAAPPVWFQGYCGHDPEKALQDWLANARTLQPLGPEHRAWSEDDEDEYDEKFIQGAVEDPLNTQKVAQALNASARMQNRAGPPMRAVAEARVTPEMELEEKRRRCVERAEEEAEEAASEARYLSKIKFYQEEIRTQAEALGGFFILTVDRPEGDERPASYKIPSAPFEYWSLWRTNLRHLAPKWSTVCESGLKMYGDDASHSDWMVGAEPPVPLNSWHGREEDTLFITAVFEAQEAVQNRVGDFQVAVMCGTGRVRGEVLHPDVDQEVPEGSIIVIPHAGPEYAVPAMSAGKTGAIITQAGGRLAHLTVLGQEMSLRMVRIEDALALYPEGTDLDVDLNRGRVTVRAKTVRGMLGEF